MRRGLVAAGVVFALAGCLSADPGTAEAPADWAHDYGLHCMHPPCTHESPVLPGVVMAAERNDTGKLHSIGITVRNDGDRTYHYLWVPGCDKVPWIERFEGSPGTVQPREPEAQCDPCGWERLSPGAALSEEFQWDERVWDPLEGSMRDAPSGRYVWTIQFAATEDGQDVCQMDERISMNFWVDVE